VQLKEVIVQLRGKKITDEQKEKVRAVIYLNPELDKADIARQSGIPESTVHGLLKDENFLNKDKFEECRAIKKAEFINKAWEVVQKALKLTDKRFTRALEDEDAIKDMIDDVYANADATAGEKKIAVSKLRDLQMTNIRDIAIALGTIYDKQALASGEPTTISERVEPTPDLVKEMDKKVQELKQLTGT
jgi:uncharacterized protein YdcH (DUF465 family)